MRLALLVFLIGSAAHAQPRDLERSGPYARAAAEAYRTALDAFARGDAQAYEAAYAPALGCFYDREGVSRSSALRPRRRHLEQNAQALQRASAQGGSIVHGPYRVLLALAATLRIVHERYP